MYPKFEVTVTVDETRVPPSITFSPDPEVDRGFAHIKWKRASNNFQFAALAFAQNNPVQNVVVADEQITADDFNQEAGKHYYRVFITVNNVIYPSKITLGNGGPTIRNH